MNRTIPDNSLADQPLGAHLLAHGLIVPTQLKYAQQKQEVTGETLSQVLVRLGLVSETALAHVLAEYHQLPYRNAVDLPTAHAQALALFTREACLAHALLPLAVCDGYLDAVLGNADPHRAAALIRRRSGLEPRLVQGDFAVIKQRIDQAYLDPKRTSQNIFEHEYRKLQLDTRGTLPTDDLVQQLLRLAVHERATDIHLQPEPQSLHVSFRVDGVLIPIISLDRALLRLVAAIKVMSAMDISDNLRPQDGRYSVSVDGQQYDVRVSTSITPHGESMVMRLLPKGISVSGLADLGFAPEHLALINSMFQQPHGMLLMTGPTGSGKTTTLHAGLKPHGMTGKNILTVEDPIEYELPVASQTQVNRKAGYTFDSAIRHFLRHDPDIMLVGEIRDTETAEAAMRAAETGHLVLSTLHVNSVFGVVGRLGTLGMPAHTIADTLIGCINQRLVRRICEHCKVPFTEPTAMPAALAQQLEGITLMHGAGCEACRHTGYQGRMPVYEILVVDAAVARWIETGGGRQALMELLTVDNHVSVWDTCTRRIRDGETTVSEFLRIFGVHDTALLQRSEPL